jgi:hypothetical protein
MFLVVLLAASFVLGGAYFLKSVLPHYATAIQRSWLVRLSLFAACGLLLLGVALVPLPNKHRLVALVPIFFLVTVFLRVWKSGKARVGLRARTAADDERMKRSD